MKSPLRPRKPVLLVLDAGTASVRAALFDPDGRIVALHRHSLTTHRPTPGHAELDPAALLAAVDQVLGRCLDDCDSHHWQPEAMGLSVQRSSFVLFDTISATAAGPILSWQDHRARDMMDRYASHAGAITATTGLLPSPHFGGPKLAWLLEHDATLRAPLAAGNLKFVPLASLLAHHLTGNLLIDESIAGRTLVFDIRHRKWDEGLLETFGWPKAALPEVVPTTHAFGHLSRANYHIPLKVCLGDQQAAMLGLGAGSMGEMAINFGTSGSVLLHTGHRPRFGAGLLSSIAWSTSGAATYLLEGTINAVGALFAWFADRERRPELARRWIDEVARESDLVMVPGINGLAAPYWRPDIETTFVPDRDRYPLPEQLWAGMASIALLGADIMAHMHAALPGLQVTHVHCGGGMAQPPLLQLLADLTHLPLESHHVPESTATGVAALLAAALGWTEFGSATRKGQARFVPLMNATGRDSIMDRWHAALEQVLGK
ncbi:MAG: hypothetical protein IIA59_09080 [Candidatus Marinimicrobia bacterium]|nr:hypothetical protein [Candidatus Neomarinimicrobiota bacterium]